MTGLVLDNITKRFGSIAAVDRVHLSVPDGSFVCLLGPSGCGKTTLLRMIAGLEEPSEGRILVGGADVTRTPAHQRDFGMVFQSLALFPHLSVGENIAYPLRIRSVAKAEQARRVEELLALVRLPGFGERPVSKLSGGQRQRVAIARALACQSELVVLDEPTSALDVLVQARVLKLLKALKESRGLTYVFITHDLSVVRNIADRVAVFEKGRLVELAATDAIFTRPENPYTRRLIGAVPVVSSEEAALRDHIMEQENGNA